jgi:tetratricopeptide (TPR) repeat protein
MRVCDAVGTHSVHYVEDPESPITQILGNNEWVDTVRFPRTTLLIQAGDCDDTSALLASLLESIGIRTAIMTSPGHVFMAFDSGEPEENMWLFQSLDLEAVAHAGRAWIPVETTVLSDGFLAAWLEASRLIRTHGERGDIEFLPVHEARDAYPPLSLPRSTFAVVEPLPAAIDELFDASVEGVVETLYANGLATLRQQLAGRSGTDALKVRNQIGILHARFGEDAEAERTFASTITTAPEFIPAYVNMANLRQSAGDFAGAIDVLEEALQYRADSIYLNLALARSHFQSGAAEQASRYFALVRERAPSLAERYAYIDAATSAGGDAVARAGAPGAGEPLIWAVE